MDKKHWATVLITAGALFVTLITGVVQLESRITRLEAQMEERKEAELIIIGEIIEAIKLISRVEGKKLGRQAQEMRN